ncbi:hypothetical protein PR048_003959 [Dryococelus australis]|uniref:Transposase n=1 Tax=Dryococelus australis TaxID=614101 RepID=A0ABQ9I441_9NEOP|nr:hypothetical protein PR048_003959 [Dryococelus australis]
MTTKQVEMCQLEQLVQDRVKDLLRSKYTVSVIVEAVTAAVSDDVIRELFNLTWRRRTNSRKTYGRQKNHCGKRKLDHFLAQDELEQFQRRSNLRVFGIPESEKQHTDTLVLHVVHNKL